jgi:hypothetical protein
MSFICRICDHEFEAIPDGSIAIGCAHGFGRRYQMMRFPDGAVHDLRKLVDPPEPPNELLAATIQALSELPTPISEELEQETAMSIAFRRFQNN